MNHWRLLGYGLALAVVIPQATTETETLREGSAMQASRIHHVGLPVSDLDLSVAWYREALGLTHDSTAGIPGRVAFMVAPTGERLELLAVNVQPSAWDDPIAALRAGVPHTAWTVDDLDATHARAVEAGGRSVWTPRDTPEPGQRIAVVADPDGNLVELLSSDQTSSSRSPSPRTLPAARTTISPRPSFDLRVPVPPTLLPVAGTPRLVYELHLTNFARDTLVVERVDVLDADGANLIAEVDGASLDRRLSRPGGGSAGTGLRTMAPGTHGVLYLEIDLDGDARPREVVHRIAYDLAGRDVTRQPGVVRGARIPVRGEPTLALAPPLRGGPWAAVYDPSWERGHRRVVYAVDGRARIPGRFAVDWFRLDADGRLARDEQDLVSNWHGYGADVLAVANAVVAATRDDVAESATVSGHTDHALEEASGNYVALDLGDGRYAYYEHLMPGSVRVQPGERVQRGQVIGSVGFTGSSSGPHLHLHVADANTPLGAEGMPYVLDRFRVLGVYDDFGAFGNAPWTPLDGAEEPERTGEFPAPKVVVDFSPEDGDR